MTETKSAAGANSLYGALASVQAELPDGETAYRHPHFPLYLITSAGRVFSIRSARFLKPIKMGQYLGLQITGTDGKLAKRYVHRLVLEAVTGPGSNQMAFDQRGLNEYVDVAQRIADFRERYPEGSLQPADPANPFDIRQVEGVDKNGKEFKATFIVYRAAAYRAQDDQRPGIGMAWEVFPGRTPYTLGSELMNAETSAWGRAIVATLASDSKRGVSSREEVRNRSAEQDESWRDQPPVQRQQAEQQAPGNAQWETPPAEPVTDMDWMSDLVDTRIAAATDRDALNKCWTETVAKQEKGECEPEHATQIKAVITERAKELGLPAKAKADAQANAPANGKEPAKAGAAA